MMLSDKAKAALEIWNRHIRYTMAERQSAAWDLAVAMSRLFPVREIGGMVIRWDDEITWDRLKICGGQLSGDLLNWYFHDPQTHRRFAVHCWLSNFGGQSRLEWEIDGRMLAWPLQPKNMGGVLRLLDDCGIEVSE